MAKFFISFAVLVVVALATVVEYRVTGGFSDFTLNQDEVFELCIVCAMQIGVSVVAALVWSDKND